MYSHTITETCDLITDNCLKPKTDKIKKYKIFGFDIETYGKYNKFLMGSIYGYDKKNNKNIIKVFWDKKEMQNYILNSHLFRGNTLFFATNLGFDFLGLFDDRLIDLNIQFLIRGTQFLNIKIKTKSGHTINFRDTLNFLKASVENIGKKVLGIEKLTKPKCLGKKPKNEIEKKQLEKYNIRDSEITFKFANFLQDNFNELGTNIKYTIASTSMSLFQNKYLTETLYQPKKEVIEFLFKAYYGGRTEIFKRGKVENLKYYDINSLYPYVMDKFNYPHPNYIKNIKYETNILNNFIMYSKNDEILNYINNYEGVTKCFIEPDYNNESIKNGLDNFPILPTRDNKRGKLLFCNERQLGYYSNVELRKALDLGYKISPIETYFYVKTFNPFKIFVRDLYKKRLEAKRNKSPTQLIYKILMNANYGKWCQKMEYQEVLINNCLEVQHKIHEYILENKNREKQNKPLKYNISVVDSCKIKHDTGSIESPQIYYVTDLERNYIPKFINPILGIYITSYARLELYKLIENIVSRKFDLYYCDTDSVICNCELPVSKKLGALKKEYDIIEGVLVKPKMYFFKGIDEDNKECEIYKCKGLMNISSYKDFISLLETKKYSYTKFSKFKESIRRHIYFNEKMIIDKVIDLEDNKREWEKEFNYNELQDSKPIKII